MRALIAVGASLILVMLGGCSLTTPLQRPAAPIPGTYPAAAPSMSGASAADIGWRSMFRDARLQRLIDLALHNNRDLKLAALNVEQVRAQYAIQRSALLPRLDATVSTARSRAGDAGTGGAQTQASASLGAAYELDLFGRLHAASDAGLARYLASDEGRRATQIMLVAAVADAYYAARLTEAQVRLAERTVHDWRESFRLVQQRHSARQSGVLDLVQAEAQVAAAEADLEARRRERAVSRHALAQLIGQELHAAPLALPSADLTDSASPAEAPVITRLPAGLPSDLLTRRPDLREKELALAAAHADVGAARAALFPRIALTASVGVASASLTDLFKAGTGVWSFVPQITQPLFNAGQLKTEVRLAELRKAGTVLEYERAVQTAFREVADGLAGSQSYADQVEAQERAARAAERRAALAEMRYRAGVDSRLERLDAQRQLYAARQSLLDLRRAEIGNAIALYKALGGGLSDTDLSN